MKNTFPSIQYRSFLIQVKISKLNSFNILKFYMNLRCTILNVSKRVF